ncbi:MAG: signal peptidase I [Coprobacillus sp.]
MNEIRALYKKIFSIVIIVLALFFVFPLLLGYTSYAIETNSMSPTISSGSVIYVRKIDSQELKLNDIITFEKSNEIVTHRIVGIDHINNQLTTKGDAIKYNDEDKTSLFNVKGKVEFSIPFVGYVLIFLKSTEGIIMSTILGVHYIISILIPLFKKGQPVNEEDK